MAYKLKVPKREFYKDICALVAAYKTELNTLPLG